MYECATDDDIKNEGEWTLVGFWKYTGNIFRRHLPKMYCVWASTSMYIAMIPFEKTGWICNSWWYRVHVPQFTGSEFFYEKTGEGSKDDATEDDVEGGIRGFWK